MNYPYSVEFTYALFVKVCDAHPGIAIGTAVKKYNAFCDDDFNVYTTRNLNFHNQTDFIMFTMKFT